MGGLLILAGIIWLVLQIIKDASIKPTAPGTDIRRAYIDSVTGKVNKRDLNRRLSNGYYVNKK